MVASWPTDQLGIHILGPDLFRRAAGRPEADKKINTPADMAGIKLRMPGGEAWQFLGTALGANPTPMAYAEVYTGLQTGAIDGQDNPLPNVENMKFYEVMSQIVLTSHLVGFDLLCRLRQSLERHDAGAAGGVPGRRRRGARLEHRAASRARGGAVEVFKGKGLQIYTPDVEAFRKHVQKTYLESELAKSWPAGHGRQDQRALAAVGAGGAGCRIRCKARRCSARSERG